MRVVWVLVALIYVSLPVAAAAGITWALVQIAPGG